MVKDSKVNLIYIKYDLLHRNRTTEYFFHYTHSHLVITDKSKCMLLFGF